MVRIHLPTGAGDGGGLSTNPTESWNSDITLFFALRITRLVVTTLGDLDLRVFLGAGFVLLERVVTMEFNVVCWVSH